MIKLSSFALGTALLFFVSCARPAEACSSVSKLADTGLDASEALLACTERAINGERLDLRAGTYTFRKQVRILKSVTIATAGLSDSAAGCASLGARRCAILRLDIAGDPNPNIMPMEIVGHHISFVHLIVEGVNNAKLRVDCTKPYQRPLGGGLRVIGSQFTLRKSVLRNFTCYTGMEVITNANSLTVEDNVVGPNGDHRPGELWSDGVTIHDSRNTVVRRNVFVDNSDVQLILGGCRDCRVEKNIFRHSGAFRGASFAELMLHAFPTTSGNHSGTIVTGNRIDCGASHLCGFGIMVGGNPWTSGNVAHYPGQMFGSMIRGNTVTNARIGINIDGLTGPIEVRDNSVTASGGRFSSDCGSRDWPAVNVAPGEARWVRGNPSNQREGSVSTIRCILARGTH